MKQSDRYTWILYLEKLPIKVQDSIKTFSDMWDLNYFPFTFSQKDAWGLALSKRGDIKKESAKELAEE